MHDADPFQPERSHTHTHLTQFLDFELFGEYQLTSNTQSGFREAEVLPNENFWYPTEIFFFFLLFVLDLRGFLVVSPLPNTHLAMGQNPVPPKNIPIPTKTGSKLGEFTNPPNWDPKTVAV